MYLTRVRADIIRHSGAPHGARKRAAASPEPMNTGFQAVLVPVNSVIMLVP
jgi:hypothetical protein